MPPPGTATFPQGAGIDVIFNGFNQVTGQHWQNQKVESYKVTYTYKLNGADHSATQTASGDAASVLIKPYEVANVNNAVVVGISVTATYATGSITRTVASPQAFTVY